MNKQGVVLWDYPSVLEFRSSRNSSRPFLPGFTRCKSIVFSISGDQHTEFNRPVVDIKPESWDESMIMLA